MLRWRLVNSRREHFLKSVLAKYPEEELTLTFGALSAEKFNSSRLEGLKRAFRKCIFLTSLFDQAGFVLSHERRVDDSYSLSTCWT